MTVHNHSHITEFGSQILEFSLKSPTFGSTRAADFYHNGVRSLMQSINLNTAIPCFFACLRQFLPITYLVYMSAYANRNASVMRVDSTGCKILQEQDPLSLEQIKDMYRYRVILGRSKKGFWITEPSSAWAKHLNSLNSSLKLEPPYHYFFLSEQNHILGNIFFGCSPDLPFSEEEQALLDSLWEPLFLSSRAYSLYHEMEMILDMTQRNNLELRRQISGVSTSLVGSNSGLSALMQDIRIIGPSELPVLINGETGTGKELVAKELHQQSLRREKNFVAVNCGGIAPSLIDSELFGHVKGAFTGAFRDYKGRFERASGGTLFLDEIGELPMEAQTRLLRVLQDHTIERLGGNASVPVDFRLITATNRDLRIMMNEGTFREDLYYRLSGVTLSVPPLRQRPQDIPLLVQHYLAREAVRMGVLPRPLAAGEMEKLLAHHWPGNVRELINVVSAGFVRSPQGPIRFQLSSTNNPDASPQSFCPSTYDETLRAYFRAVLQNCGGRVAGPGGAANLTGLKPNTLRAKLDKLDIPYGRSF